MRAWLTALALAVPAAAAQQAPVRTVTQRDSVRAPVLEALRVPVERELRQPVRFVVRAMRTGSGWAYVEATPKRTDGRAIDLALTPYADAVREGGMDGDTIYALLRQERGGWRVEEWVIGPTDVAWQGWPEEHGVPRAVVFPPR